MLPRNDRGYILPLVLFLGLLLPTAWLVFYQQLHHQLAINQLRYQQQQQQKQLIQAARQTIATIRQYPLYPRHWQQRGLNFELKNITKQQPCDFQPLWFCQTLLLTITSTTQYSIIQLIQSLIYIEIDKPQFVWLPGYWRWQVVPVN